MNPLGENIVAKKEAAPEKTASGILLGQAKEKPAYAVVEAIGPEVKAVKTGDKIICKDYTATNVELDGEDYIIVKEEDVLATLK